jgi:hypothetical protein
MRKLNSINIFDDTADLMENFIYTNEINEYSIKLTKC